LRRPRRTGALKERNEMKRIGQVLLAIGALAAAPFAEAQKLNMQDGLWEVSVKMEMPGMPAGAGAQTFRKCYTPADVQDASRTMPKDDNCQASDVKVQGDTVSWTMRCKPPQEMTGTGTMTYKGTSYAGRMNMAMKEGGQTMTMQQTISGRRVGPCT
jgi:hypothetical protein